MMLRTERSKPFAGVCAWPGAAHSADASTQSAAGPRERERIIIPDTRVWGRVTANGLAVYVARAPGSRRGQKDRASHGVSGVNGVGVRRATLLIPPPPREAVFFGSMMRAGSVRKLDLGLVGMAAAEHADAADGLHRHRALDALRQQLRA